MNSQERLKHDRREARIMAAFELFVFVVVPLAGVVWFGWLVR